MTTAEANEERLAVLRDHLTKEYALAVIQPERGNKTPFPDGPAIWTRPALRIARHFDLQPDLCIHFPATGSLGLLYLLPTGEEMEQRVEEWVSQAAYLKYLLRAEAKERLPYAVELVLVAIGESGWERRCVASPSRAARSTRWASICFIGTIPRVPRHRPLCAAPLPGR